MKLSVGFHNAYKFYFGNSRRLNSDGSTVKRTSSGQMGKQLKTA